MLKVIIADDERVMRETISALIDWESLGVKLAGLARDGIEAYNMILDESPDIVMTDIMMPGLSGLELISRIAQTDMQTQFILLSGYEEFEYAREAMKYGVKHYLLKPCDEQQIMDSILQTKEDCIRIGRQKKDKEQQNAMRQVREIFLQLDGKEKDKAGDLCAELKALMEKASQREFSQLLAGNIGIAFSEIDVLSIAEAAEFIRGIHQESTTEAVCQKTIELIEKAFVQLDKKSQKYGYLVESVMKYVDSHLGDQNLTLKQIAEQHLFMNVDHVSKQFQKVTGTKFSQYLTEQRVNRAKELLMHPETSKIQYVAMQVGCGDNGRYFSQIFKKAVGMTPSMWAEQMQEKRK